MRRLHSIFLEADLIIQSAQGAQVIFHILEADQHLLPIIGHYRFIVGIGLCQVGLVAAAVMMATLPFAMVGCNRKTEDSNTVKVGILHSLSGTMAISETSLKDAEVMAIEEINAAGGVLGKQIVPVIEDPASEFDTKFPELAKKLLLKDKVACVFGCWTSVSRKNVLSAFEDNNGLLFYPVQGQQNFEERRLFRRRAEPANPAGGR